MRIHLLIQTLYVILSQRFAHVLVATQGTSASSGLNGSWSSPSMTIICSEICWARNTRWKMYYGITECSEFTVTLVSPPPPPAVTVRTSQHADTMLSALSVPSPGSCIRGDCEPSQSERQQLAKPHDKSLPSEERAGSKSSCWESQLAVQHGAQQTRSYLYCAYHGSPCILIQITIKSAFFSLWWHCWFCILSFNMFNQDKNISSLDFLFYIWYPCGRAAVLSSTCCFLCSCCSHISSWAAVRAVWNVN